VLQGPPTVNTLPEDQSGRTPWAIWEFCCPPSFSLQFNEVVPWIVAKEAQCCVRLPIPCDYGDVVVNWQALINIYIYIYIYIYIFKLFISNHNYFIFYKLIYCDSIYDLKRLIQ
jgi:hypothetical protein